MISLKFLLKYLQNLYNRHVETCSSEDIPLPAVVMKYVVLWDEKFMKSLFFLEMAPSVHMNTAT